MSFSPKQIIAIVILFICILLAGCGDSQSSGNLTGQNRPSYCVTVEELASRLSLTVRQAGNPYYELSNSSNTVKIFMYDGGRVYVNGTTIGTVGQIQRAGGKQYIPELLVPNIRSSLIANTPIQPWTPPSYTPTPRIGSGTVVIDPGHGGKQPGAISYLGYHEDDINLQIATKVAAYLRQAGVEVVMTRTTDKTVTLDDRVEIANRVKPDLFASIHQDANPNRNMRGYLILVASNASQQSKQAARALDRNMETTGISSRGMRKDSRGLRVLKNTTCPAVLIECGHISNPTEENLLESPGFQNRMARAIADGILEYL